jgi:hypothetical protein
VETTDTGEHKITQNVSVVSGTTYTFSIYAKAAEQSVVTFYGAGGLASISGSVNLITGAVVTGSVVVVAMDNGWWRISASGTSTFTGTNSVTTRIAGSYTGDGTSGIYIFGAQLSDSASVDPYVYQPVAAPASTAYYGPRFDYDPVTLAPKGLLIEEQRTNLFERSEEFDNAYWTKTNATITANTVVAPDGSLTGEKLIASTEDLEHRIQRGISVAISTAYTFSCYVKKAEYSTFAIRTGPSGAAGLLERVATVDLNNGSIVSQTVSGSTQVNFVGNGWYRVSLTTAQTTGSGGLPTFAISPLQFEAFEGDGTSGIFLWGAQLEAGAFATSYIPSVASQVTRAADNASMIGNNFARWYNVNEGTLYLDSVNQNGAQAIVALGRGTFATNIAFNITNLIRSAGTTPTLTLGTAVAAPVRLAAALKPGDFAASANGAAAVTDSTNLTIQNQANQLQIGNNAGGNVLNGSIKRISYYNRRLANTELVALTS